ncbi:MAG: Asp-tRNA(Asn)/Glu-tRNA(Gln) amidotransferase GatCAB subunit B, partial [Parcubacteria group bacterium CG10_big_fil_rev_8_21_14_0_10_35_15]
MSDKYQPIIGLEIHIELATKSKMFCGCDAFHFNVEPNTHCCPVCLALPGALPVPNKKAIDWTIMLGLALGCNIPEESKFDRKNYFYPDLPKGYQISQYDQPLCSQGKMILKDNKEIRIRRVHLEEDTAKLIHNQEATLIDFNRSGVPLLEVVTEPDFENVSQVDEFLKKLQLIVRYLGISAADMEKGSMRLEPNISVRTCDVQRTSHVQDELPSYKVEVKNINSFRFVRKAIAYEVSRQRQILEKGGTPSQQTMGWDEAKSITILQRNKEEANDYRYFPEPDIPLMSFNKKEIDEIKKQIPELPDEKIKRFLKEYGISNINAQILIENKELAQYFEEAVKISKNLSAIQIANWIINKKINIETINPKKLIETIVKSKQMFEINDKDLEL